MPLSDDGRVQRHPKITTPNGSAVLAQYLDRGFDSRRIETRASLLARVCFHGLAVERVGGLDEAPVEILRGWHRIFHCATGRQKIPHRHDILFGQSAPSFHRAPSCRAAIATSTRRPRPPALSPRPACSVSWPEARYQCATALPIEPSRSSIHGSFVRNDPAIVRQTVDVHEFHMPTQFQAIAQAGLDGGFQRARACGALCHEGEFIPFA